MKIECPSRTAQVGSSGLNPYSNGMKIEFDLGKESDVFVRSLNPYSNGMKIELRLP